MAAIEIHRSGSGYRATDEWYDWEIYRATGTRPWKVIQTERRTGIPTVVPATFDSLDAVKTYMTKRTGAMGTTTAKPKFVKDTDAHVLYPRWNVLIDAEQIGTIERNDTVRDGYWGRWRVRDEQVPRPAQDRGQGGRVLRPSDQAD